MDNSLDVLSEKHEEKENSMFDGGRVDLEI
jgi:hypothetical protein